MGGAYSLKLDDGKEVWKHPAPANARMSTGGSRVSRVTQRIKGSRAIFVSGMTGGSYGVLYVTHNLKECLGVLGVASFSLSRQGLAGTLGP